MPLMRECSIRTRIRRGASDFSEPGTLTRMRLEQLERELSDGRDPAAPLEISSGDTTERYPVGLVDELCRRLTA